MSPCPCGSGLTFIKCCKPFITGKALPHSAEQLMRSRYCAYTRSDVNYLAATQSGKAAQDFDKHDTKQWAQSVKWLGLKVLNTGLGQEHDTTGTVEFIANFKQNGRLQTLHEISLFHKIDGKWQYVDQITH